ncbi:hypothetical protein V1514DRAFT_313181 [Lipomyces japonicus]|uniref:uncharacterized protein n=1 Tax=Lipomyces japonicus TaxID=56871 RepID=UPI0034CD0B85
MSQAKKLLNSAKTLIDKNDYAGGKDKCLAALEFDSNSVNAYILLGYCLTNLWDFPNAEQAYIKVTEISPKSPFGWQGLLTVFEKSDEIGKYIDTAKSLILIYEENDDINRATAIVNKLQNFVTEKGNIENNITLLKLILPKSPIFLFLEGRLPKPADSLEKLTSIVETSEKQQIVSTINKSKNKLGVSVSKVTKKIKREVYSSSELEDLYRELLNWSDDENQRREVEGKLLEFLYNKLLSVPIEEKDRVRQKVLELADGMVVLNSSVEHAWIISLEWRNYGDFAEMDYNKITNYISLFPDAGLSKVLQAFLQSDISPFQKRKPSNGDNNISEEDEEAEDILNIQWDDTEILGTFIDGYEAKPDSPLSNSILGAYYVHIGEYENAVDIGRAGLELLDRVQEDTGYYMINYRNTTYITLGTAYIYYQAPRNFALALKYFATVLKRDRKNAKACIGKALILIEKGEIDEARKILTDILKEDPNNVQALLEASWCEVILGNHEIGRAGIQKCLSLIKKDDPVSLNLKAKIWWRIGQSLWKSDVSKRQSRSGAYDAFITSLRWNPSYAPAYTSLGIYYADIEKDEDRSAKCFHKAFELDPSEKEAARRLTEMFANAQEWELVQIVASRFADAEKKRSVAGNESSWPHRALGVSYLQSQDLVRSIQSFQSALRLHDSDSHSWVGLGEAYAQSGRYIAALKSLSRAINLDSSNWYSKLLLGMVYRQTLDYEEAKRTFRAVLEYRSGEAVVLEHLSETLVASARYQVSINNYSRARKDAVESIEVSLELAKHKSGKFNLWKNVGDAIRIFLTVQSLLPSLPLSTLSRLFDIGIDELNSKELDPINRIDRITLNVRPDPESNTTEAAIIYYILAYKYSLTASFEYVRSRGTGWFNIANAELHAYVSLGRETLFRDAAIESYKMAIKQEPRNHLYWNAYGIATADHVAVVSQHAFIRSLIIDYRQPATWANLGVLYLLEGDLELAKLAFTKCQSTDPDFVTPWLGQGMIASIAGDEDEARELYEHSYAISDGSNKLAKLFYAVSAFSLLRNNSKSDSIPSKELAIFALEKVLQLEPDFVPAVEYQAFFLEQIQDYDVGIKKLQVLSAQLEQKYERFEQFEELKEFLVAKAQLARLHLAKDDFDQALKAALMVVDLSDDDERLSNSKLSASVTAGITYFYQKKYTESFKMFDIATSVSKHDLDITVLLSQVLYRLGGENREKSQDVLFANIEQNQKHLNSILLLGTIGLVEGNDDVIDAIETELIELLNSDQNLSGENGSSANLLLSALRGHKEGQPSKEPWLQSAILTPSEFRTWNHIDTNAALETAILDHTISSKDLSKEYAQTGKLKNLQMAIYLSPGEPSNWLILENGIEFLKN